MSFPARCLPTVVCVPALALALAVAACDVQVGDAGVSVGMVEGTARDEWTRSYAITPGGQLEIVNANGTIEIFPSAGSRIEVRATREVKSHTDEAAQQMLTQMAIVEEVAPDRVRIETKQPRQGGFLERRRVTYRVNVPPGLSVSVRSEYGGVRLENVEGRFTAASTNGPIDGRGVSGSIDASTVNGGIDIELARVTADGRMTAVNGGIHVEVRPGVSATLDASATNGGVVIRDDVAFEPAARDRRHVTGAINKGGPRLLLQTTHGGIVVGGGTPRGEPREVEGLRAR